MINLLSPEDKKQLAAARTNTLLRRYVFLLAVVVAVLALEMTGVYLFLGADKQRSEMAILENNKKTAEYSQTQAAATKFKSDLATAKFILDKQVDYISLITGVAQALPNGAVLETLVLNPETFGLPTTLTIHTNSYGLAIDVKKDLQKSAVFSDVSFLSVSKDEAADNPRPYTAVYNVTFAKGVKTQ